MTKLPMTAAILMATFLSNCQESNKSQRVRPSQCVSKTLDTGLKAALDDYGFFYSCDGFKEFVANVKAIEFNNFGIASLAGFDDIGFREATSVYLSRNKLTRIPPLTSVQMLRTLDISHNQITSLEGIASFPQLMDLHASHNPFSDCTQLESTSELRSVDLAETACHSLAWVSSHPLLHRLNLENANISDPTPLKGTSIESLNLRGNPVSLDLCPTEDAPEPLITFCKDPDAKPAERDWIPL